MSERRSCPKCGKPLTREPGLVVRFTCSVCGAFAYKDGMLRRLVGGGIEDEQAAP